MKKILLIIFLFLCCINVFAEEKSFVGSEYLDDIFYIKSSASITQYKKAQVIRDTITGDIAYCVEPYGVINNNSAYDSVTSFDLRFGLTEEKWEKIKLYSYYGYGYQNHQSKEWISITQMMIWRTIYPYDTFEYVDNLSSKTIIAKYVKELIELYDLVHNHSVLPNFESEYVFSIGKNITLYDSNYVLSNYKIISSDFDSEIINNSIKINIGNDEKEGKILLQRASEEYPNTVKFFYSEKSQNVMQRGNINPINMELKIKIKSGKIIVNKVDSETKDKINQGEANLNGSIFELLNDKKEVIKELTINDNTLEFDNLPFGKYYVREKKPGEGYYLNNKEFEIIIDKDNLIKKIDIENQVIKSKVKITKYYGTKEDFETGQMKKEKNIVFIIYNKEGKNIFTGATNDEGFIEVDLPYGSYEIEQINTTFGYNKVDNYKFTINEDNSIAYDISLNDYKIEVPNAYISIFQSIYDYIMELLYA